MIAWYRRLDVSDQFKVELGIVSVIMVTAPILTF